MKNIIEASQLPEGEKVYMKKDWLGWRIVNPIKNEDGSLNWFNILVGGKRNLVNLIVILIIASLIYLGFKELVGIYDLGNACNVCMRSIGVSS